jgi:hypothetical protein
VHIASISGDSGGQGGPPFCSRFSTGPRTNTRFAGAADGDDGVRLGPKAVEKTARFRLGRQRVEDVLEVPLLVGFGLAIRACRKVREYAFPGCPAEFTVQQRGQSNIEMVLQTVSRPSPVIS